MELKKYLNKDLIFTNLEINNDIYILEQLGLALYSKGYVKNSFTDALIQREKEFPTGIENGAINIAIPHADPKHVFKPTIAIATSKTGIKFKRIDNPEKTLLVKAVFLLAIKNAETQLTALKELMDLVCDYSKMNKIINCDSSEEVFETLMNIKNIADSSKSL